MHITGVQALFIEEAKPVKTTNGRTSSHIRAIYVYAAHTDLVLYVEARQLERIKVWGEQPEPSDWLPADTRTAGKEDQPNGQGDQLIEPDDVPF
jgi:hypothetical protein